MKRMLLMVAGSLGLAAWAAGCTVGPDYAAPELTVDEVLDGATTQPSATTRAGITSRPVRQVQWWAALNDPELDSLVERAVAANFDLRIATSRLREARGRRAYVAGGALPSVDASALYNRERYSKNAAPFNAFDVPGFPWEFNLYQAGFDASWELDLFGATRRGVEAATADAQARVEERRGALLSVMAEVARNYVELRGLQHRLGYARQNLAVQQQTLALTRDRLNKGVATQLDVARAVSLVSRTAAAIPELESLNWQAAHRIAVLLGQPPSALVAELSKESPIPTPPREIAVGVAADLLRRRPDIRAAERMLAAATARVGEATAELYPRFSLTGSFNLQASDLSDFAQWKSHAFGFGPAVHWPVFDAGRIRAGIEVRSAEQEEALVRYQQSILKGLSEVQDAIVSFTYEQARRGSLLEAVAADEQAATLAQQSYTQGLADFLTVLDAQRTLYQSQDALAQSEQALTTSLITLYKALGGGWEIEAVEAAHQSLDGKPN